MPVILIESERLFFRALGPDDVTGRYVGWLNDHDVNQFLEVRFVPQTFESCARFVAEMNSDRCQKLLGIFEKSSQKHIGNIKLGFINEHHKSAQLSLFIGEKLCRGKGYGGEAIKRISHWGFEDLGLWRIEAGCYDLNLNSLKAFLTAGYSVEGYARKSIDFAGRRIGCFLLGRLKDEHA